MVIRPLPMFYQDKNSIAMKMVLACVFAASAEKTMTKSFPPINKKPPQIAEAHFKLFYNSIST